ncbi:MAG: peptidoglycan DD-metalloendopeptidase family protein [Schaedlerella sp.]|nr:peptidoglycan DD-metalloendopeptidase family protein [Schaedlerella sp.]
MNNSRFIQTVIVAAISFGMLFTNIDASFALTTDNLDSFSETPISENTDESSGTYASDVSESADSTIPAETPIPEQAVTPETETNDSEQSAIPEIETNDSEQSTIPKTETNDAEQPDVPETETPDTEQPVVPESSEDSSPETDTNEQTADQDASESETTVNDSQTSDKNITDKTTENSEDKSEIKDKSEKTFETEEQSEDDLETGENLSADQSESSDSEETSKPADSSDNTDTQQKSEVNISHQESKPIPSEQTVVKDNNKDAIYIQPVYTPSELFIDLENRIKYNTALPIDNIPSFITQEMIVGALKCQDETGYPASVTIAQIILESGFGKYGPGGSDFQGLSFLAYEYCNLFGIKGFGTAGSVDMRTGEQTPSGEYYTITAGFRVYNTYTECIEDRTTLLKEVYSDLTAGVTDANTFATRIGSRWATSLQYSQNLISIMQRYDLYRLDRMTLKNFSEMIGRFADPCPGSYLTSSFGYRTFDNSFHKGIDLGTNSSAIPTYAADAGTVIIAGYNASAGNWIVIDHGNGLVTKYMHHSHIFVNAGDEVEKGQQIGLTGNTGNSFGVHLHFQVEENGVAVDPTIYLNSYME